MLCLRKGAQCVVCCCPCVSDKGVGAEGLQTNICLPLSHLLVLVGAVSGPVMFWPAAHAGCSHVVKSTRSSPTRSAVR
jgi:hypothetical protein